MTEQDGFWWNWWVQALVAFGTTSAVVVAVLQDWIKEKLTCLSIKLENPLGVYTPTSVLTAVDGQLTRRPGEGRYYQVRVKNTRRAFPAHQVYVWLLKLERHDNDGVLIDRWTGEIPIIWQHQDFLPPPRTLGNPANADVCAVFSNGTLALFSLIPALNLTREYREPCNLFVTLQARSDERTSRELQIHIWWDGGWDRDDQKMLDHLTFEVAS